MRVYLKNNVYEEALERIRYVISEFDSFGVWFSGGKDSTVILNLVLKVAEEQGRLPVPVCFVDQEAEWGAVVRYTRTVMSDPRVKPYWLQVPIRLFNSTSAENSWLNCWAEGENWMREQEEISIKDNKYDTDRFGKMFDRFLAVEYPDQSVAFFGGVRAEESPSRNVTLTYHATYKHITWGKIIDKEVEQFSFYPIYDWGWRDIWKAIHKNGWPYCTIYDQFYRYGISPIKMRVSNLHHETAYDQLFYLQEMEPETWNKLTQRLKGIGQARHITKEDMFTVTELPYMFSSWSEYRDYLVENLIPDEKQELFRKRFAWDDDKYADMNQPEERYRCEVQTVLSNDYYFTKLHNFNNRPQGANFLKFKRGLSIDWSLPESHLKYIKKEQRGD